jgi:hypothetical protein
MCAEEVVMSIQLTPQQLQALDARECDPPRVVDPRSNVSYVLVSESEYETVREVVDDEQRRRSIHAVALRNAMGRMDELP